MSTSSPVAHPLVSVLDLNAACKIERSVRFASRITLLLAAVMLSQGVFLVIKGDLLGAGGMLILLLLFALIYGFLRVSARLVKQPVLFALILLGVLLFYAVWGVFFIRASGVLALASLFVVPFIPLAVLTSRALVAIHQGALKLYATSAAYKRKYAKNGSYWRFILFRGLLRPQAAVYLAGAIACLLLIPFANELNDLYQLDYPRSFIVVLMPLGWMLFRKGARLSIAKTIASEADIPPSFTLYLRSFLDDATEMMPESQDKIARIVRSWFGGDELDVLLGYSPRLEEISVAALWPFGPVLCLGVAASQPLGALRLEVREADWQVTIARLIDQSTRIVLMISPTVGLAWEYQEIMARRLHEKLIVILLPELPQQMAARWAPGSLAAEQLLAKWAASIRGTELEQVPNSVLEGSLIIRFLPDGSPLCLRSDSRTAITYSVALAAACMTASDLVVLSRQIDGAAAVA